MPPSRAYLSPEQKADDTQRQDIGDALHKDLDTIVAAWPSIQHVAYTMTKGYPSQPPDGAGARLLTQDELDNGVVHLTPVERYANDQRTDHAQQAVEWFAHLKETMGHIRTLASEAARITIHPPADHDGDPGCKVHATLNHYEPADKAGRCRWCYDFYNLEGIDPPADILQARIDGKRITMRMVQASLAKTNRPRRRGRR